MNAAQAAAAGKGVNGRISMTRRSGSRNPVVVPPSQSSSGRPQLVLFALRPAHVAVQPVLRTSWRRVRVISGQNCPIYNNTMTNMYYSFSCLCFSCFIKLHIFFNMLVFILHQLSNSESVILKKHNCRTRNQHRNQTTTVFRKARYCLTVLKENLRTDREGDNPLWPLRRRGLDPIKLAYS